MDNSLSAELLKLAINGASKGKFWKGFATGIIAGGAVAGILAIRCKQLSDENRTLLHENEEV